MGRSIDLRRAFSRNIAELYISVNRSRLEDCGPISRCALSLNRISRFDRGVRWLVVPIDLPDRKIPISRRYDNLAPASFLCLTSALSSFLEVSVLVLLRKMHKFRMDSFANSHKKFTVYWFCAALWIDSCFRWYPILNISLRKFTLNLLYNPFFRHADHSVGSRQNRTKIYV